MLDSKRPVSHFISPEVCLEVQTERLDTNIDRHLTELFLDAVREALRPYYSPVIPIFSFRSAAVTA